MMEILDAARESSGTGQVVEIRDESRAGRLDSAILENERTSDRGPTYKNGVEPALHGGRRSESRPPRRIPCRGGCRVLKYDWQRALGLFSRIGGKRYGEIGSP